MKWNVVAPFFTRPGASWIDDYVTGGRHRFAKIPFAAGARDTWHERAARGTPLAGWRPYWRAAGAALQDADGVVTLFPQLAVTTAIRRTLGGRRDVPIVAWCFNLGRLPGGARRMAARAALRGVERFVVHSTAEVSLIADYLGIPHARVRFVPLQRAPIPIAAAEEEAAPFVVAMGSANRDYATLAAAARITGLPVTIVASPRSLAGIDLPPNVTVRAGLSPHDCHLLAQRARISVVPLADVGAASGQVTVIEAQRMRRPVIATRSIGTVDYVEDGVSGVLVGQGDADDMATALIRLWESPVERERIGAAGADFAAAHLSDEAAAAALAAILDEVAAGRA